MTHGLPFEPQQVPSLLAGMSGGPPQPVSPPVGGVLEDPSGAIAAFCGPLREQCSELSVRSSRLVRGGENQGFGGQMSQVSSLATFIPL